MSLRDLILHNFWLKLFSLLLATLIWFAVRYGIETNFQPTNPITNPIQQTSYRLAISVLTQPGDSRIFKLTPETVFVTVNAEAAILREVSTNEFHAYVDLTTIRHNERFPVKIHLHSPDGLNVIEVRPLTTLVEQISP
jgi:YbbR domain-containing protein